MTTAIGGRSAQLAALVVYAGTAGGVTAQAAALAVYAPPATELVRATQELALAPYMIGINTVPRTTQLAALVVYGTGTPGVQRSRAWTFTLDGHTFYVLNLGQEGTFLFDAVTQQWCQFDTNGYGQWNMLFGTMWGARIVGADAIAHQLWELVPTAVLDEGWRDISHAVTGAVSTRSRAYISCDAVRITASFGVIDEVNGATMSLRFSDDSGQTWSSYFTVPLTSGNTTGEVAWRSLGSFMAPGRIFELTDIGGLVRIDGCDAFLGNFDDNQPQQQA